ncbi:shikimate kinase AroK [Alkalilimnicola sp. S0819]|uniref:shikimate kinase AroK n=1 Tax=Alkalilimnicola sp. S0819 TaxID=2613922 RepID=UPI001261D379|nr:shikimate kinase AroK [Alkalilimnicola sp. S0819]KAB7624408.1 shikimate kinase AroK [Alkalilimnicola sp. S0819]MPQ16236.1 shikimate kinase AroK [Alkalilimnicola sp. S0819]
MSSASRSIFLVGPMGAGKSTIGRRLAQALGLRFVDSDHCLEERTGVRIPVIFEIEGEAGFREREARLIEELTREPGIVLATGGGAVITPDNRRHLGGRGTVIYLRTSVDRQLQRTRHDRNRPLLQTADPRARLAALLAERDPLYREVADLIVDTDRGGVKSLVRHITEQLERAARPTETL